MKKHINSKSLSFILIIIYNFLFWREWLGINLVLFALVLMLALHFFNEINYKKGTSKIILLSLLINSAAVIIINSQLSIIMFCVTFYFWVAYVYFKEVKSVVFPLLDIFSSNIYLPGYIFENIFYNTNKNNNIVFYKLLRKIRLYIFPALIVFIFYVLYAIGSPYFFEQTDFFIDWIFDFLNFISVISFERVIFLMAGLLIIFGIITYRKNMFKEFDIYSEEDLKRKRNSRNKVTSINYPYEHFKFIALKTQNKRALITVALVNILLIVLNITEIRNVWFNFSVPGGFSLKYFVHEATYILICSVILSIIIMLYYFNSSQNFYPKNRLLIMFSYAWIIQNVILCLSLLISTYYYIDYHGFAYNRQTKNTILHS